MDSVVVITSLSIVLAFSILANVVLVGLLRGMVPSEVANMLARMTPPEVITENSKMLSEYLRNDGQKWNDIIAFVIELLSDHAVDELEEIQKTTDVTSEF